MENQLSDKPRGLGPVLKEAGYGRVVERPSDVIEAPGFQAALQELGLKEALIKQGIDPKKIAKKIDVLLEARDKSGEDDYTAIDKGLKHATAIFGINQEKPQSESKATYNFIFSSEVQAKVKTMEEEIKNLLTNSYVQPTQENVETQPEEFRDPE